MSSPEEVLSYWFPEGIDDADPETRRRQMQRRMGGVPEVDREITERFGETLEQARRGELDHWADTPRGRLALIVVLDQFSRHVYRGSPLSYAQDEKALGLALEGIDSGMDRGLGAMERMFFWLPLGHSGDLALEERGVLHKEEDAVVRASTAPSGGETSRITRRLKVTRTASPTPGASPRAPGRRRGLHSETTTWVCEEDKPPVCEE